MLGIKEETLQRPPTDVKRIRKYYKQLYVHKFNNLDEMGKFLERHKLTKAQ